jgi:hypothetical protein
MTIRKFSVFLWDGCFRKVNKVRVKRKKEHEN